MPFRLLLCLAVLAAACRDKEKSDGTQTTDDPVRSRAAFAAMAKVLMHPRCINCHPAGESPTQGDEMAAHQPPVVRGEDGHGAVAMRCGTCHGEVNVKVEAAGLTSMPGNVHWKLAPASMAWQDKTAAEICEQLKDPDRNGGKSMEELYEHNAKDSLVGWGWDPGAGRAPAPGSQAEFARHTREWIDTGAHCPET